MAPNNCWGQSVEDSLLGCLALEHPAFPLGGVGAEWQISDVFRKVQAWDQSLGPLICPKVTEAKIMIKHSVFLYKPSTGKKTQLFVGKKSFVHGMKQYKFKTYR